MDGSSSQVLAGLIVTVTDGLSVPTADFVKLIKAHGANNQYLLSKKVRGLLFAVVIGYFPELEKSFFWTDLFCSPFRAQ